MTPHGSEHIDIAKTVQCRILADPQLHRFEQHLHQRIQQVVETERKLTGDRIGLSEFASGHEYFGMHYQNDHWVFREWAPSAKAIYLKGAFSEWRAEERFRLSNTSPGGVWELELPANTLKHGDEYRLEMHWPEGSGDRIPAWTRRVVLDAATASFNAQIWRPERPYEWRQSPPQSLPLPSYFGCAGGLSADSGHRR